MDSLFSVVKDLLEIRRNEGVCDCEPTEYSNEELEFAKSIIAASNAVIFKDVYDWYHDYAMRLPRNEEKYSRYQRIKDSGLRMRSAIKRFENFKPSFGVRFHGGCGGCTSPQEHGLKICLQCEYSPESPYWGASPMDDYNKYNMNNSEK